jgi:3-deoxy-D-manno-octulosonate 8-phosphate phosphatase (KDO 8-P phosphatase)
MKDIDFTKIDLLVLDVDGVMTDGSVMLSPTGEELKTFHARDGTGMKYWRRGGGCIAMLTGRSSPAVVLRAGELEVEALRVGLKEKLPAYLQVLAELGVSEDRAAVVGDDLPDLPLLARCAFPVAVADAVKEVRQAAAYVTNLPGGKGAVREVVELIMKAAGKWPAILARYHRQAPGASGQ